MVTLAQAQPQIVEPKRQWGTPRDPAEILRRVDAIAPLLEEEAQAIEKLQHLTPRAKAALVDAGVFSIAFSAKDWGGPEMRMDDQIRMIEKIAYHSASAAWNVQILADGGYFAAKMNQKSAHKIFSSIDFALAGSTRPAGKAVKVDGGYRVSGHFSFGSGIRDAEVIFGAFYLHHPDGSLELYSNGTPKLFQMFLPPDKVVLHDTWYTTGLEGSGSVHFSVDDVFVPEENLFENFMAEGDLSLPPLSRYSAMIVMNVAGVPLGVAHRAIDEFRKIIEKPSRTNQFRSMKTDDPYVPAAFGEATALYQAARAYALASAKEISDEIFADRRLSTEQQAKIAQVTIMTVTLCRQSLELLLESLGSRSVLMSTPLEKLFRDMSTIVRHQAFRRKTWELAGVYALELPWPAHLAE